jgi:hypothetical protein
MCVIGCPLTLPRRDWLNPISHGISMRKQNRTGVVHQQRLRRPVEVLGVVKWLRVFGLG